MWHERLIQRCKRVTEKGETFRFQRYVLAYREQQRLRENSYKLNREIVDLSIPMLKRLQWLRLATGEPVYPIHQIDKSCGPNQLWSTICGECPG